MKFLMKICQVQKSKPIFKGVCHATSLGSINKTILDIIFDNFLIFFEIKVLSWSLI